MSRYIDVDALLKYKAQLYDENGVGFYAVGTGNILRMPTADVVKVKLLEDGTLMLETDELDKINRVIVSQGTWCKIFYQDGSDEE